MPLYEGKMVYDVLTSVPKGVAWGSIVRHVRCRFANYVVCMNDYPVPVSANVKF